MKWVVSGTDVGYFTHPSSPPSFYTRLVFFCAFISALFLFLLQLHPYMQWSLEQTPSLLVIYNAMFDILHAPSTCFLAGRQSTSFRPRGGWVMIWKPRFFTQNLISWSGLLAYATYVIGVGSRPPKPSIGGRGRTLEVCYVQVEAVTDNNYYLPWFINGGNHSRLLAVFP